MPLKFPESLREALRARLTQRGAAALLAVAVELGIVLLFLTISSSFILKNHDQKPNLFRLEEKPKKKEKKAAPPIEVAKEELKRRNGGGSRPASAPSEIVPPDAPVTPDASNTAHIIWMTRNDYRASDIAGKQGSAAGLGQGNGTSAESDSALADGKGPHGEKVYVAEWYREPTHAQLDPYVPDRARGRSGWGEIMCRTVPNYRVEDCRRSAIHPRIGLCLGGAAGGVPVPRPPDAHRRQTADRHLGPYPDHLHDHQGAERCAPPASATGR